MPLRCLLLLVFRSLAIVLGGLLLLTATIAYAGDDVGNRLTYLDEFCDPYYPSLEMPKLTTPQWVGEAGVEAVVTLGIDDMRDAAKYENYLRPILDRLKEIDGRAPVSILTNQIDPAHPQLQSWLKEGLSLETHTADHPCPCLYGGDFAQAKSTYDRCVDQLAAIENSHPVAFRFPCMDSLNTPSPRAYVEILNGRTDQGNFCQISTSTLCILTADDPALPRELVVDDGGQSRLEAYVPFKPFVNKVYNYPYPYVISQTMWEFPCGVPDDWQGQKRHAPRNPKTVSDLQAMIDATVVKQGIANVVFHPYDWLRSEQIVEVIDHVQKQHAGRVKFLNFNECLTRINQNLLAGQPLRAADGQDNGVRLLDVNNDGYLDVVIGNAAKQVTRLWQPEKETWREVGFPVQVVEVAEDGQHRDGGVRFGVLRKDGNASLLVASESQRGLWHFDGQLWTRDPSFGDQKPSSTEPLLDTGPLFTVREGKDLGVRLRDINGDGVCELLVAGPKTRAIFHYDAQRGSWQLSKAVVPEPIVDDLGRDAGLRLVDLNEDGRDDMVFSDEQRFSVHLFVDAQRGWARRVRVGSRPAAEAIPMISRAGTNNGAWFVAGHMWIQNEDTDKLPAGIDRRSFAQLLGTDVPPPRSPEESLQSMRVRDGLKVELVAAEPLVQDPIAIDWGADGKLWVVEMADYPLGLDNRGMHGGRVRFLEDTTGDGKYDKSTVFLDGLAYPTGVMAWRDGVLISSAPQVIFASDTTGDGRADRREVLFAGFALGNQQHRMNGFAAGLDNWIYLADGGSGGTVVSHESGDQVVTRSRDVRIRPYSGSVEAISGHSQFGRRRDDWGNWFGCDNVTPLRHFLLQDAYLARNKHAAPASTHINITRSDNTRLYPTSRVLSHFQGYRPPAPGEPHRFTSASATDFYRDDLLGAELTGNTFTSAPVHNLVHRRVMSERGLTFFNRRAPDEQRSEFLASSDSWFRPTTARTGPDGALWVVDMVRLVIEHPEWIDDTYEKQLDLRAGHQLGRIYRVVPQDKPLREVPRFDRLSMEQLVARLESPNGIQRDLAQRLLLERGDEEAIRPLKQLVLDSPQPLARLHALYTLDGLNGLDNDTLAHTLADEHPGVRRHAVRLSESRLNQQPRLAELVLANLTEEAPPQLRLQIAYSLGEWSDPRAGAALGRLAVEHRDDAMFVAAVFSSLTPEHLVEALPTIMAERTTDAAAMRVFDQLTELAAAQTNLVAVRKILDSVLSSLSLESVSDRAGSYAAVGRLLKVFGRQGAPYYKTFDKNQRKVLMRVVKDATSITQTPQSNAKDVLAAIDLLGQAPSQLRMESLRNLERLVEPAYATEIQTAAVRALSHRSEQEVAEILLERITSLTPKVQSSAFDTLLMRTAWTESLLDKVEQQELSLSLLSLEQQQKLRHHRSKKIRQRVEKSLAANSDADRRALVSRYLAELIESPDLSRGRQLFAKHCATCHRLDDVGFAVGPDLAALKDRSPQALLTAVLDPNRAIESKFRNYSLITTDGRILSGLLIAETSSSVTLLAAEGKEQVVLRSEIDDLQTTGRSLMPEGMESQISPAEMVDLLAFLRSLGAGTPAP